MTILGNDDCKKLCLDILAADTEAGVIALLTNAGLWSSPSAWRLYGDRENNFSTIGNQQSRPDAALVEKLVNSEDARLMSECMRRGIDPESPNAPQNMRAAVARFFDEKDITTHPTAGRIALWSDEKRRTVAQGITLCATGASPRQGRPCFTIADCGEGQTPDRMPDTLLSLDKSNKLRIPFVQGKFNMGGTGVLKFCGRNNLELVLSKRDPKILPQNASISDSLWGFTVVRRQDPPEGSRSSVYTYLAPVSADQTPGKGGVLRFEAEKLEILPEKSQAYTRDAQWGTLVKLYEFGGSTSSFSNSNILMKDGLLSRMDLLLAEPALPIRLHECRPYTGHSGSFDTSLTGLVVRLEDAKQENLEPDFPVSCPLSVDGEKMMATIYAFKKGRADTYRKDEGIIFTMNGQVHGNLTKAFFTRQRAGRLDYIANSLLVIVDCSDISARAREDLFMNSRDRLSQNPTRQAIESQLEVMLKENAGLAELKSRRRAEEIQSKLAEEKPLEDIIQSLLKQSPTLASLFLTGARAANPFKTVEVSQHEKEFEGKHHPTYFKFKGRDYGKVLNRDCNLGQRCRITFETDTVNDYFSRQVNPGTFALSLVSGQNRSLVSDYVGPFPQNGIAVLSLELPQNAQVGDSLEFEATVSDPTLLQDFTNRFSLSVKAEVQPNGNPGTRRKPPANDPGDEREIPSGIALPNIIPIEETNWGSVEPAFHKHSALRVRTTDVPDSTANGNEDTRHDVFDFIINMDNVFLKSELKSSKQAIEVVQKRWQYALVLVGLALLHDDKQKSQSGTAKGKDSAWQETDSDRDESGSEQIDQRIEALTIALAPVLLPMIESLGALDIDSVSSFSASAESV